MSWEILDTGYASALENMRIDAELLDRMRPNHCPLIHFYEWDTDAATYGYFTDPKKHLNLDGVIKRGISLARRSTGGGIIFHVWDMAFSVLVPSAHSRFSLNTLENYAFINQAVLNAIQIAMQGSIQLSLIPHDAPSLDMQSQHFCMAKPTKYDVLWEGKKVAGAAQRKTKNGFLHQGTISLVMPPPDYLQDLLLKDSQVLAAMQLHTFPLLGNHASCHEVNQAKRELKALLVDQLRDCR